LLYLLSDRLKIFVPLSYTRSGPYPYLLVGFDLDLDLYVAPYCLFPTKPLSLINMLSRSTLLFALYAAAGAAAQTCYGLTGAVLDHSFAPCNPDAKHSGCCATNRTTGADVCLDSGLCMSTTSDYMGTIWQPGCTDSTGKATECPQVCPGSM
jgi:hypothetical protein